MALKILAYGDAGAPTGFEKVMRGVLSYLQSTGKFEVIMYGLGYRGNPDIDYPYPVWPAEYEGEFFGMNGMEKAVSRHNPDMLFITQDLWNVTTYMCFKPPELPAVVYYPVDTPNIKWGYALGLGAVAEPVVYTNFGAQESAAGVRDCIDLIVDGVGTSEEAMTSMRTTLEMPHMSGKTLQARMDRLAKYQNIDSYNVIPHGLDRTDFYPMDKKAVRKLWGMNEDDFIVGSVNTNQFRKRQDLLFRMFAVLLQYVPTAKLLVYCQNGNDERGWDLPQLARYHGINHNIYLIHSQYERELTVQELNEVYNVCDVMVNTSGGEGWGLTSFESAACGVAQMVPDWSATGELWKNHGILIPVSDWRFEPKFLNTAHAIVDVKSGAQELIALAKDIDVLNYYSKLAYDFALTQPSWDDVGKQFERVFFKTINNMRRPVESLSIQDAIDQRTGTVKSYLSDAGFMKNYKPVSKF